MLIALLSVRKSAIFTALDSAGKIDKISPAFVAERVERTLAEEAIGGFAMPLVARIILTLCVGKVLIAV